MNEKETMIRVSYPIWKLLQKERNIGESFDQVLRRILVNSGYSLEFEINKRGK